MTCLEPDALKTTACTLRLPAADCPQQRFQRWRARPHLPAEQVAGFSPTGAISTFLVRSASRSSNYTGPNTSHITSDQCRGGRDVHLGSHSTFSLSRSLGRCSQRKSDSPNSAASPRSSILSSSSRSSSSSVFPGRRTTSEFLPRSRRQRTRIPARV